jgi:Tfp pilus assembly protein FimT
MLFKRQEGYSLVEVIIIIGITGIIVVVASLSLFNFRNSMEYDILLNEIVESVNSVKSKAVSSRLDSADQRINYSMIFFDTRFVEFEGSTYVEGNSTNIEHNVATSLSLSSQCNPENNGTVSFTPILGLNNNTCTVYIYKVGSSSSVGTIVINTYGIEAAF